MSDTHPKDQEPSQLEATGLPTVIKTRQPFVRLRRELSEEELSSPAVQRLLLDEVERLEIQVSELNSYRERYHASDKRAAVLEQVVKKSISSEVIFSVCLCVGAASLGYAPSVWANQPSGYIAIVFGLVLILGGTLSRMVKR